MACDGRQLRLTPRVLDLGFAHLSSMPIWNLAAPGLSRLQDGQARQIAGLPVDRARHRHPARLSPRRLGNGEQQAAADGPELVKCWRRREPARQLANLRAIPVLVVSAEASYHAPYDHCTAAFLQQAGVPTTYWRLEEHGIHGNGHLMMQEKNNLEIARKLDEWLTPGPTGERPARPPRPERPNPFSPPADSPHPTQGSRTS